MLRPKRLVAERIESLAASMEGVASDLKKSAAKNESQLLPVNLTRISTIEDVYSGEPATTVLPTSTSEGTACAPLPSVLATNVSTLVAITDASEERPWIAFAICVYQSPI